MITTTSSKRIKVKTHVLRINCNNLKKEVISDYFKYRDIFYRCLIVNICLFITTNRSLCNTIVIEDSYYNKYLEDLYKKQLNTSQMLEAADLSKHVDIFLDLNVYLEEFVRNKHDSSKLNIFNLTIDDNGYVAISNKKVIKAIYVN